MLLFLNRKRTGVGMITGVPASIDNKYVPGSGVGASSTSARRAKSIRSTQHKSSIIIVVPPAPTSLSGVFSNGTVTISFVQDSDGGAPISNYSYSTDGGVTFIKCNPKIIVSPVIITGLPSNGNTYSIKLKAANSAGLGEASAPINIIFADKPTVPTNVSASSSNSSATISFTNPTSNGGSAITNYQYSLDGGLTFTAFSPAVTISPVTISGLSNGTTYSIQVRPVNVVGFGTASSTVTVTPVTTPSAPTITSGDASNNSAVISFTSPNTGGSAITNYKYSTNGGSTFTAFSPSTTSSPVKITGLTNGTPYSIQLKAVNSVGDGTSSSSVSVTPATFPNAPTSLIGDPSNNSAKISFAVPSSNGGSVITNYQYSTNGGTSFTDFSPSVTSSPVMIGDLSNGTSYSIQLKAVNSVGAGTASSTITVTPRNFTPLAGSLSFNTTNKLNMSPGTAMGSGAYTVECWFYNNSSWSNTVPYPGILGCTVNSEPLGLAMWFSSDRSIMTDRNGGGWRPEYTFASPITLNKWHHLVLVRNSSMVETVFIDGVKATSATGLSGMNGGQQTNSANYSGHSDEIGHFYQGYWPGYLTNFRIVAGTAMYDPTSSSITTPNGPLTAVTNTQYLMLGSSVTTDTAGIQTITNVNSVTQTATIKPF